MYSQQENQTMVESTVMAFVGRCDKSEFWWLWTSGWIWAGSGLAGDSVTAKNGYLGLTIIESESLWVVLKSATHWLIESELCFSAIIRESMTELKVKKKKLWNNKFA